MAASRSSAAGTVKEVRLGRNYLRVDDTCDVKLPGKTQYRSGWTVKEITTGGLVRVSRDGHWRFVSLDAIRRVAQTKNGKRKEVSDG